MLLFMLLYYDMHVNYIETIQRHSASLNNSNNSTIQQLGAYTIPQCMAGDALHSCCCWLVRYRGMGGDARFVLHEVSGGTYFSI